MDFIDKFSRFVLGAFDIGKADDAIPPDSPPASSNNEERTVYIATHELPFGVDAFLVQDAKYLNDQAEIFYHGKIFPNPVHHWAIVVGDFEHGLNAEASQQIVYQNRRVE